MEGKMTYLVASNIRELTKEANKKKIQKEDIVSLIFRDEQYVLTYYTY